MKKRKIIAAIALTLGVSTFAACTDSDKTVIFNRYWQTNATTYQDVHEELTYGVTFEKGTGTKSLKYSFDYQNGEYKTLLTSESKNGEDVYTYKTSLTIDVAFACGSQTQTMKDTVETEVTFRSINYQLHPLSSKKTIVCHTPTSGKPSTIADCYTYYAHEISTEYDVENKKGTTTVVRNFDNEETKMTTTKTYSLGSTYTYLDNEQLLFALRGIPNTSYSASFKAYSPFIKRVQKVSAAFSTKEKSQDFDLTVNGETKKLTIPYRTAELSIKETYSGEKQTLWIATAKTTTNNPNHNVILHFETPLAYSFGKLIYNLKSVTNN